MENDAVLLHEKIDLLTNQVSVLTQQLELQNRRQAEMEEFRRDFMPIANHMIKISIDELAEVGNDFSSEDLLFLLKRVLRNTHNFIRLLEDLEGIMGFVDESKILGLQMFNATVHKLDELERAGYFELLQGLSYVTEQVVSEFGKEDVIALGDNIVTILKTVRAMTQPEVLGLADKAIASIQAEPALENQSAWALLRELSDPKVRKGMARMLNLVKVMADAPVAESKN